MDSLRKVFRKGYTLAELLIVIGIIGVVSAFMIPSIMSGIPSKYESLHKKAAYMLEHTVSDIVNNEVYYERMDSMDEQTPGNIVHTHGLANTYPINIEGKTYGSNNPTSTQARQKFCQIFASKFNLKPGTTVNCSSSADFVVSKNDENNLNLSNKSLVEKVTVTNKPTFTSAEGIQWILPISTFSNNTLILYKTSVDYNSGPNCAYVSKQYYDRYIKPAKPSKTSYAYITTKQDECERPDIFVYVLTPGGKLLKEEATSDEVAERNNFVATPKKQDKPTNPIVPKPINPITPKPINPTPLIPKS